MTGMGPPPPCMRREQPAAARQCGRRVGVLNDHREHRPPTIAIGKDLPVHATWEPLGRLEAVQRKLKMPGLVVDMHLGRFWLLGRRSSREQDEKGREQEFHG